MAERGQLNQKPLLRDFPDSISSEIEPDTIPFWENQKLKAQLEQRDRVEKANVGMNQLKHFINKNGRTPEPKLSTNDEVYWPELPGAKAQINSHALMAIKAYSLFEKGWTIEEIITIAEKDPEAAFWLVDREPEAPILRLQEAANKDPQWAYFFAKKHLKRLPPQAIEAGIKATGGSAYYHCMALSYIKRTEAEAIQFIQHTAHLDPEAAYTYLRMNMQEEVPGIVRDCLLRSGKWSYLAAAYGSIPQSDEINSLWQAAKERCFREPQWAYHWLAQIEPESANKELLSVASHPGWLAQLMEDLPETTPIEKRNKIDFINSALSICQKLIQEAMPKFAGSPYYETMTHRASTKMDELIEEEAEA